MLLALVLLVFAFTAAVIVVAVLASRARRRARAAKDTELQLAEEKNQESLLPALVRDLRPSFDDSVARLRKSVRGIDFRYGVPWYLLIGPADSGKTTLVGHAPATAHLDPQSQSESRAVSGIGWHYFDGGVVIDVAASLALPGARGDVTGWRALLRLLKRHRPRRPVEGIVVAVPASLLLDPGWKARTHDIGATIRERLVLAQADLGFAVPVYVVITHADQIAGFTAFTESLPDNLQQDMIGWSNPHAPDVMFEGGWIDEAFAELHRCIVQLQVELFAASRHLEHPSELFLFSGELQRIADPLRSLLDEMFRPSVYRSASMFRGFYLSGLGPDRRDTAMTAGPAGSRLPISFVGDLLNRKVFSERGLALPLPGAAVARNRVSVAAQVAAALLAVVLLSGTLWANARLQGVRDGFDAFFSDVSTAFDQRIRTAKGELNPTVEERIARGYHLVQGLARLGDDRPRSIFLPASLVASLRPAVERVLQATFGEVILPDFRSGLEEKGRSVFAWNPAAVPDEDDTGRAKPTLADSAHYAALERFAADYRLYVENYFRYAKLSSHESGDVNELADLGNYVTGHSGMQRLNVPEEPYGHALRDATAHKVDCGPLAGLVERRAREGLEAFAASWFGDRNPVRASEQRFVEQWKSMVSEGADLMDLVEETNTLSQAVNTWAAIGARSGELRLPVLDQSPFKAIASTSLCEELRPDLSPVIRQIAAQRDNLSGTLLVASIEPFGPLLDKGEKGLVLGEGVAGLKASFDDLQSHDFRTALPSTEGDMTLPQRPTWRPEAIDHAVALYESFDKYRSGAFPHLGPTYRHPLVAALEEDVAAGLAARLAFDVTEGEPLPAEPAALSAAIAQLGARLTKISRMLPFLENGDETFARHLETALNQQATDALQRLERDAAARHPFIFARQTDAVFAALFDVQSGAPSPADVAKRWAGFVDEQRESLRRYALEAEPLVRFLSATHGVTTLTRRWSGIVDDVTTFDQKIAGSGLASLDAFLRDSLPLVVPDHDCGAGAGLGPVRAGGSYLIGVRNDLLEDVTKHCRELARTGVQARYAAIAQSFNTLLASRFPFTQSLEGMRDAAPADILEFLRVYDRQNGRSLAAQLQARSCGEEPARFLRRIDALYPMFAAARELPGGAVALDIVPEFRVNRDREIGGSEIAQWSMDIGRQTIHDGDPVKPVKWVLGDPVQLTMRFAKDSPEKPIAISSAWRRLVEPRTVRMEFQGTWSLLALLRAGHPASSDLIATAEAAPNTLRFDIPVERDPERRAVVAASQPPPEAFRLYVRVRIFQPGKQDPITAEEFPVQAPATTSCPGT